MEPRSRWGSSPPFALLMEGDDEELERLKRKIERERGFDDQFYKVNWRYR